jgi:putative component of membrane protein insertase Oxa1/YidC/SpoIIIJ protein YidD
VIRAVALVASVATLACRPGVRVGSPCTSARAFAPFDDHRHAPRELTEPDGVLDAIVVWYQRHGRARELPGVGCPFAPTCSAYARTTLHRYGPLGVILIVDRLLVREHVVAGAYYPTICVAHTTRLVDDVP